MNSRNMPLCLVVWIVCAAVLPPSAFPAEKANEDCFDKAQTQADLNDCAGEEFAAADAELNRVYKAVLEKYKADSG
ncbi:MAG TPA: lysozyme inhibitor LprI family protein, partial [Thermoanaerobaculia bacterium]|nr:lysozyme inhibitor LprI family protein [Thermoanaerobaculia bacterium]